MAETAKFKFSLPALRVLENEHQYLSYLMEEWHIIVLAFERNIYTVEEGHEAIQALRKLIVEFIEPLKNHTEKEEAFLFPMLAQYVGDEQGPVQATEEEHEEIDAYIGHFLHHTLGDVGHFTMEDMQKVVNDAAEAFEVLAVHFVKEESILFPMVDNILRIEEQDKLYEQLYTPII
ncbi:hemerythrin domain-containing protein [Sporosarcina pasteurii]|uniref:Iron-sulfur cluster repair di-iron protein n=1 Tax=Sporosarcina pasteurii TaxID=1474 RepID=A0A380BDU1_SPOPA|nr:hemerythrin domain-containing protein [Sporosarcina pasteurii]MDS9472406.1 hemerythrin domain-containing protein [Sporosarcina pasteurii]SUI98874.1 iron-sulfur cluster repair di-iron protein [Sporosarcina pasteurii]